MEFNHMAEEKIVNQNETEELTEEKVAEILQIRRDKLKALQDAGRDPFMEVKYDVTATSESIRANFKDPDLNISQIAVEFRMTPTYVSAVLKKQTGKSILDVIRQMRIEYAKELLESDMSVEDVAFAAGFRESSTFIRAFKNYHGITPGQMKKLI
jgi:AraC-like DNA-binding protein